MSWFDYVKEAVNAVYSKLIEAGNNLDGKADSVMHTVYHPDLDFLPVLNDNQENYYQNLIGVLRWSVEFGCNNIHV